MTNKKAYLIGIKGVGMAALALYLKQAGYEVSGSDNAQKYVTQKELDESGIKIYDGYDVSHIEKNASDLIIASAAFGKENPEVKTALKRNNFFYYSEVLGQITKNKKLIAVAGVHGKTTITAMLALILEKAGLNPSYLIGGVNIPGLAASAKKGDGEYFVLEADEYKKSSLDLTPKFLDINPQIAVISSIELDHPDVYSSEEDIYQAFYRFACRVPRNGFMALCIDYPKAKKLIRSLVDRRFETYGFDPDAKWQISAVNESENSFKLNHENQEIGEFSLRIPGKHNFLNATAAIIIAHKIGLSLVAIKKTLASFSGVERRFQKIAKIGEIEIIDDYAHHPTAISQTLRAAKNKFPDAKIWCIFQPHTYTRTQALLKDFSTSFKDADKVIITEIFGSAREEKGNITGLTLAEEIKKNQNSVHFINDWERIKNFLKNSVHGKAVIMTMGAGDIYKLAKEIQQTFREEIK